MNRPLIRTNFIYVLFTIPIIITILHAILAPDYTLRRVTIDGTHDYFYNGLLILDGQLPIADRHPGTPLYYLMACVQFLISSSVSGVIRNASLIIKSGSVILGILSALLLYIASKDIIQDRPKFVVVSLFILYSTPPFLYNLTYFDSNFVIPVISLAICFSVYQTLTDGDPMRYLVVGFLFGFGASIKLNILLLLPPILSILIAKYYINVRELIKGVVKLSVTACVTFLLFSLPSIWALPTVFYHAISRATRTTSSGSPLSISLIFDSLLVAGACMMIISSLVLLAFSLYVQSGDYEFKNNLALWSLFSISGVVLLLFIDQPFGAYEIRAMSFRQISPIIIMFVWATVLLSLEVLKEKKHKNIKLSQISLSCLIIIFLLTSSTIAYDGYNSVQEEYVSSDELEELMQPVEGSQGRTAVPANGFTQYDDGWVVVDPGVFFHLHGSSKFTNEYFSPIISDIYPNVTNINTYSISLEESNPQSTPPTFGQKLHGMYKKYIMSPPNHHTTRQSVYGGQYDGISVTCVIYQDEGIPDGISKDKFNNQMAHQVGFKNYTSSKVDSDHISGNFTHVCSI